MPTEEELPEELSGLAFRQAFELTPNRFRRAVEEVADAVERLREGETSAPPDSFAATISALPSQPPSEPPAARNATATPPPPLTPASAASPAPVGTVAAGETASAQPDHFPQTPTDPGRAAAAPVAGAAVGDDANERDGLRAWPIVVLVALVLLVGVGIALWALSDDSGSDRLVLGHGHRYL